MVAWGSTSFAQENTGWQKIANIGCHRHNTTCYVSLENAAIPNPAGCAKTATIRWRSDDPNGDQILSLLMTIRETAREAKITVHGASCEGDFPRLYYMDTR